MLRALAFVQKPLGISPGQRFRLEQWEPHLRREHDIAIDYAIFESPGLTKVAAVPGHVPEKAGFFVLDFLRRSLPVAAARGYDVAIVYREVSTLGPALYERVLSAARVPFVLDFDDAIWLEPPPSSEGVNGAFAKLRFPAKTATIASLAQGVTVGSEYLARWARQHSDAVHVVPTSIDLDGFPRFPEQDFASLGAGEPFTVCWTGSFSTLKHLAAARPALEALARRRPVRLRVICDRPPPERYEGVDVVFERWDPAREAEQLAPAHVGIMPLPDDEFTRGKCGCKALQYMAVGRATVVSPVGANCDIVKDGVNGLYATTTEEWVSALDRLASDVDLRRRLALEGRKTVEQGFSARSSATAFAHALRSAASARPRDPATRGPGARGPGSWIPGARKSHAVQRAHGA